MTEMISGPTSLCRRRPGYPGVHANCCNGLMQPTHDQNELPEERVKRVHRKLCKNRTLSAIMSNHNLVQGRTRTAGAGSGGRNGEIRRFTSARRDGGEGAPELDAWLRHG